MHYSKFVRSIISLGSLTLLVGCASYKAQPLKKKFVNFDKKSPGVHMECIPFDKSMCLRYFDRDILAAGYQPIQVSIENNTDKTLVLLPSNIQANLVSYDVVAGKLHTNTALRVFWLLLPFGIFPAVYDGICSMEANKMMDADFQTKSLSEHVLYPQSLCEGVIFVPHASTPSKIKISLINRSNPTDPIVVEGIV